MGRSVPGLRFSSSVSGWVWFESCLRVTSTRREPGTCWDLEQPQRHLNFTPSQAPRAGYFSTNQHLTTTNNNNNSNSSHNNSAASVRFVSIFPPLGSSLASLLTIYGDNASKIDEPTGLGTPLFYPPPSPLSLSLSRLLFPFPDTRRPKTLNNLRHSIKNFATPKSIPTATMTSPRRRIETDVGWPSVTTICWLNLSY